MSERDILAAVLATFGAHPYLRIWRQGVGAAWLGGAGQRRMVRFGLPGMADVSGILRCGRRVEIECKTATGRLTLEQRRWGEMVTAYGALYVLARSTADVEHEIRKHLQACAACLQARPYVPPKE